MKLSNNPVNKIPSNILKISVNICESSDSRFLRTAIEIQSGPENIQKQL